MLTQVEERRDPSLKSRPMGVQQNMEVGMCGRETHCGARGAARSLARWRRAHHGASADAAGATQVAAVNYEARAYGLFNRISVEEALRRCPGLVLVRGDNAVNGMQRYRSASHGVLRLVMQSLDDLVDAQLRASWQGRPVETPSFDDIFVRFDERMASAWQGQCSGPEVGLHAAASDWARNLRAEILRQMGLTCSAGIAATKLAAALATKKNKPNGQWCVEAGGEAALVASARLQSVRGAGITGIPPSIRSQVSSQRGAIPPGRRAFPARHHFWFWCRATAL